MHPPPPPPPPPPPGALPGAIYDPRMEPKEEVPLILVVLNIINTITHLLLGAAACMAIIIANSYIFTSSLTTHIYLCTIGYVILLPVGIVAFDSNTTWTKSLQHPNKRIGHLVMQVVGSIFAIIGSIIRISDLGNSNYNNSAHVIVGIVAMILTILSLVGGVFNFLSPPKTRQAIIKTLHPCFGTITIILAFVCLCQGFNMTPVLRENNRNMAIGFAAVGVFGVILSPSLNMFNRLRKM